MFNKIINSLNTSFKKQKYTLEQIVTDYREYPIYEWVLEEQTTVIDE